MPLSLKNILLKQFLERGKIKAFPSIPSKQLQAALISEETSVGTGRLHVPHYWAQYVHDGRGPAPSVGGTGKILVWFKDPKDDPRYPGGVYPVRQSEVRHLSRGQFKKWSRINRVIINRYKRSTGRRRLTAADYRAMDLPMIVAQNSPGSRGQVKSVPFFSNSAGGGMFGFRAEANTIGSRTTSKYVTERLDRKGLLNKTITRDIRI